MSFVIWSCDYNHFQVIEEIQLTQNRLLYFLELNISRIKSVDFISHRFFLFWYEIVSVKTYPSMNKKIHVWTRIASPWRDQRINNNGIAIEPVFFLFGTDCIQAKQHSYTSMHFIKLKFATKTCILKAQFPSSNSIQLIVNRLWIYFIINKESGSLLMPLTAYVNINSWNNQLFKPLKRLN